jgi:hypothetical protein
VNIAQVAILSNSDSVAGVVSQGPTVGKLAQLVDQNEIGLDEAISRLFRRALGRDPSADELSTILAEAQQCQAQRSTQDALEDVAAGIMATIEFVGH